MNKKITFLAVLIFASLQISPAQTILSEGFEGATFPPAGWTSFTGTNGLGTVQDWIQAEAPYTGTYAAANQYENVNGGIAEDWLVTSQIDLTSATNTELLFYSTQSFGTDYGSTYEVKVSTSSQTNHADFTTVASYNESNVGAGYELKTIDLSAYDGMMVYIAFVHFNDDGDNWIIDDIEVRSPLNLDAALTGVSFNRYSLTSTNNPLSFDVNNNGTSPITSLDVSWNDGANNYSQNFSVNIAPGQTQTINHSTEINYSTIEDKNIVVTIDNVNGGPDGDSANDSLNRRFNTLSQPGTKAVIIEESTGTWCGFCPRGTIGLDYMANTYPETVIAIAVHNDDPMMISEYDSALVGVIGSGWPNSGLDRKLVGVDPGQGTLQAAYNQQITELVPVNIGLGADLVGNTLTITAQATFFSRFTNSDYRFGVIITEDGVTGTSNGYAHVNYYSGGGLGPMGGYENLPDPVPASQMVYNHVGRAILGGFNGQANSVPAVINNGDTASFDFSYTIPATSNQANMHIVVVLIDQTDGTIVSGKQSSVAEALSVRDFSIAGMKLYPNPAKDVLNISFESAEGNYTIDVVDMLGRTVITKKVDNVFGSQTIEVPVSTLTQGNYILNVSNEKGAFSTKFIKN